MRWGLLVFAAACYRAPTTTDACAIECTTSCPGDLVCQAGFCGEPGGSGCHPTFTKVSAGTELACAIDDSQRLWCWGSNAHFQISSGSQLQFATKIVRDRDHAWTDVAAGVGHVCGIGDTQLYCWGQNDHGQVSATVVGDVAAPLAITFPDAPAAWTAVSAGLAATCAIGDGTVYCWGHNDQGQLGDGTTFDHGVPAPIMDSHHDFTTVRIGTQHACAVSASAGVFCWGRNNAGQLGPMASPSQSSVPALATAEIASSIAVSSGSTCMTTADQNGELVCWGDNASRELGDQVLTGAFQPGTMDPTMASSLTGWTAVSAGELMMCGITNHDLYCWGTAGSGGLGKGLWADAGFQHVASGVTEVSVGLGFDFDVTDNLDRGDLDLACAIGAAGTSCWGLDRYGQLGQGAATMAITPTEVSGGGHEFGSVLGEGHHVCGIEGSALSCWGSDMFGETTGNAVGVAAPCLAGVCDHGAPTPIGFQTAPTTIAVGAAHTCSFVPPDIQCWGNDANGQLGSGGDTHTPRMVPPPSGETWASLIQVGDAGTCATIQSTGTTYCWGVVLDNPGSPDNEATLDGYHGFAQNDRARCYLDVDHQLVCQGDDQSGIFGNGAAGSCGDGVCNNLEDCSICGTDCGGLCSPVGLAALGRTYSVLATTDLATGFCGIRAADSVVECWGANDRGQTGAPGTGNVTTPFALPLTGCTAVALGIAHACAICNGTISCWGDNRLAQLGAGPPTSDPEPSPRAITLALPSEPWVKLTSVDHATCAISSQGHTYCWGTDDHGALGNGATSANLPVVVP